jgi:PAS domain S-box-containing protein
MTGYERAELVNHPTIDFLDKADIENLQKHSKSRATKSSVPYEVEWLRKDGSKIPTIVSPSPIFNDKGDFTGSMAVLTDISQLKKIESELLAKNSELEETLYKLKNMHTQLVISEKMASLGQVIAGVAHEINNPINYIKGNIKPLRNDVNEIIELISEYEKTIKVHNIENRFSDIETFKKKIDYSYLIEEIASLFKGIEDGAIRTTEIIKSLRNFSRAEKDEFIKSDVHEGINSTLVILNNLIKERISVHKDFQGTATIECLPGKLNQVFMNILTNAIQAIEDKGEIFISTRSDEKNFTICIRDTGKGMTEAVANHIFEPFFSTKEPGKGTGLGLSISHSIIEKHKGKIVVNTSPKNGTEFLIHLPLIQGD